MKKTLIATALAVGLAGAAFASESKEAAAITALVPGAIVDRVADGPLRGWTEVTYNGGNVAYVLNNGRHVVFGNVVRVADHHSYTVERMEEVRRASIAHLPSHLAIRYPAENERGHLIVFTDVSCSFCVSFHKATIPELNAQGVSVTYYPWPRGGKASPAYVVMRDIWCSADPKAALSAYMVSPENHATPKPGCSIDLMPAIAAGAALGVRGTPGVFDQNGKDFGGALPAPMLLQGLGLDPL
ncbi:MAG: Thiol:disulfide interchange protein DsbC [Chloroflexi bacterium]|nr:Thiol:disulfide interchange protein DsbC [Chloroflexota bacterium]